MDMNMDRVSFWAGKPELKWPLTAGPNLWDRREAIRIVASMLDKPRVLEIGVDSADVLLHAHDTFGAYTGVDVSLAKSSVRDFSGVVCPYQFVEKPSVDFWKSLGKNDVYDFVYVDGHHGERETHLDVTQAMLRLAPGGYIMCHDIDNHGEDTGPVWAYNRTCNLPGWYSRVLECHAEGMAIYFHTP